MLVKVGKRYTGLSVRGRVITIDCETTGMNPHGGLRKLILNFGNKKYPQKDIVRWVHPARAFIWTVCDEEGRTDYVRATVDPITRRVHSWDKGIEGIYEIYENRKVKKVGHNPRFDISMAEYGVDTLPDHLQRRFKHFRVRGPVVDTQIIAHIATAGNELTYALKDICWKRFKYPKDDEKTLMKEANRRRAYAKKQKWSIADKKIGGPKPAKSDMWLVSDKFSKPYAVGDVVRCMILYKAWHDEIQKDSRLKEVFDREHELFWALKEMEDTGVRIHRPRVHSLIDFYEDYRRKQRAIAEQYCEKGLNFKSYPKISKIFYEERNHVPIYTDTYNEKLGRFNYSLNGEALLKMATGYVIQEHEWEALQYRNDISQRGSQVPMGGQWFRSRHSGNRYLKVPPDPLAKAVMEFNAAGQTISTFLRVYQRHWCKESPGVWVLHPNFKQTGAKTGRLSCSDPNLQQVASETTGRRKADIQSRPREAFGPRPGTIWYLPDYSQIEVWLFAFLSGEKKMQAELLSGRDYHGGIGKQVFGNRPDFADAKDYYRKCAKLIMFCLLYGGGVPKAATLLKMDIATAEEFVAQYHATLPGVRKFMKRLIGEAETKGEIFNPLGRRYLLDPGFAYRAVNYLIQGTAADVMKDGLIQVRKVLKENWGGRPKLILTVHDEIGIEVPKDLHCIELMADIIKAMQTNSKRLGIPVPLPVELKIARTRWSKPTKINLPPSIVGGSQNKKAA